MTVIGSCKDGRIPVLRKAHVVSGCSDNKGIKLNCIHLQPRKVVAEEVG